MTEKAKAASVYRIIQIANKKPYVAISASRYTLSNQQNKDRSAMLAKDIKSLGLYAYEMLGAWVETQEDGSKVQVYEESFFVPFDEKRSLESFVGSFLELTVKYGQESFLLGLPEVYDYEPFPIKKFETGFHYFVYADGRKKIAGKKASAEIFKDYGSIAIDPHKNRILEWKVVGRDLNKKLISALYKLL
jgi:hypothetical protein